VFSRIPRTLFFLYFFIAQSFDFKVFSKFQANVNSSILQNFGGASGKKNCKESKKFFVKVEPTSRFSFCFLFVLLMLLFTVLVSCVNASMSLSLLDLPIG